MTLNRFKAQLSENNACPVLTEHILTFVKEHNSLLANNEAIPGFEAFFEQFDMTSNTNYFASQEDKLLQNYKVDEEDVEEFLAALEKAAKLYILFTLVTLGNSGTNEALDDLRKAAHVAKKLKALLPKKDSAAFALLAMIDHLEKKRNLNFDAETNGAYTFYERAENALDEIIRIPKAIPLSAIGQFMKIGVTSAKGNQALRLWISNLYDIWTVSLSRNFKFDGKFGLNGRKRFNQLVYETISHIHPELKFGTVENSVTAFLRQLPKTMEDEAEKNRSNLQ